jgi:DNA-binding LacI/PurR family transcriptional regulator
MHRSFGPTPASPDPSGRSHCRPGQADAGQQFAIDVPLTTVGPNISTMAEQAIRILIGDNDPADHWHDITLPSELIVRQSTLAAEAYE